MHRLRYVRTVQAYRAAEGYKVYECADCGELVWFSLFWEPDNVLPACIVLGED